MQHGMTDKKILVQGCNAFSNGSTVKNLQECNSLEEAKSAMREWSKDPVLGVWAIDMNTHEVILTGSVLRGNNFI